VKIHLIRRPGPGGRACRRQLISMPWDTTAMRRIPDSYVGAESLYHQTKFVNHEFGASRRPTRRWSRKVMPSGGRKSRVATWPVAPRVVVEGRRGLDAAPSARCRPARASSCSCESDVARPGVAGVARLDGSLETSKDLGEFMVTARAVVAAESGQLVTILIDDRAGAGIATSEISRLQRLVSSPRLRTLTCHRPGSGHELPSCGR
jgi:hypothetical protein